MRTRRRPAFTAVMLCALSFTAALSNLPYARDAKQAPKEMVRQAGQTAINSKDGPYVEYDGNGTAVAIRNLLSGEGERKGCDGRVATYTGKIIKIVQPEIEDYVFTLSLANGTRERFYFYLPESGVELQDADSIIAQGNTVYVKAVRCSRNGSLNPIEIVRR